MSREETPIDWKKVDTMMKSGCSGTEIAGELGIHHDTFYYRFNDKYKASFASISHSKRVAGHANVKTRQYISAVMQGNTSMLTLLGKEWLGQGKTESTSESDGRDLVRLEAQIKNLQAALVALGVVLPGIPAEQSILHQGLAGEQNPISDELGTTNLMEGAS